ncbi:hypothetical protein [Nevskia soli]|uniref:hypothetical protein n=1 Tax=Nevskia soli TaxID=418856 RepID=UPI0015D6D87A|nr:hypothetical protein [Nevskia soli]
MQRKPFTVLVVLLAVFIGWVFVVGGRLPGAIRSEIQSAKEQLADASRVVATDRDLVQRDSAANPDLFRVRGFDQQWPARISEAGIALSEAQRYQAQLDDILRQNKRSSEKTAKDLLARERVDRETAVAKAAAVEAEARKRVAFKDNFTATLTRIETQGKQLEGADFSHTEAAVHKAEQDWPAKKTDLESRLIVLETRKKDAAEWVETAKSLESRPAAQLTTADYAKALEAEEGLEHAPTADAQQLDGLTHQLYTSWDDVLQDLDKDPYREKIDHIVTTVSAPGDKGTTVSDEHWNDISRDQWAQVENNVGMTIAHKPLGEYDSEATRIAQPPGFAYMASPAEGRNQYGYWENRDGGSFWHWLPEYLILSSLLNHHTTYVPVPSYDWDRYRQAQRYGQTYYGHDVSGAPKYGSHGTFTQQHYSSSRYVQTGGFSGSKYGSGGSGLSSSSSSGKKFGASPSESGGHKFGGSSGRSFGSSSRSMGRSFGRRR